MAHATDRPVHSFLGEFGSRRWRASLFLIGTVFLASCLPGPTSPLPPSAVPPTAAAVTPTPTVPCTWTALPSPSAAVTATPTPPWPTAQPTPTAAPPLRPAMQTAAYFFYWHACPEQNCVPSIIYALPPGWAAPFPEDPDSRDGTYYSSLNRYWYLQELRDMQRAGIDIVLPVSWGEHVFPWFRTSVLRELVEANRQMETPLRIGLFDDTTSELAEYNDFADNREFDHSAYTFKGLPLDLSDPAAGFFFYDRKIKPFFQTIPLEMWATHDGRPVEEGGRPIIVVYMRQNIVHLEHAGSLWAAVKSAFARDFQDRNGQPITPFLVMENTWFNGDSLGGVPPLDAVVDARYDWGAALVGPQWHTIAGYTVAAIGPGFDDSKNVNSSGRVRPRDVDPDGRPGDPGAFLGGSFARIPADTDLLLVETWNELYEGTSVCRAAYPAIGGRFVAEDFYIDLLRRLLRGQGLWWAAQPLPPSWPAQLESGRSYRLDFPVENTGARAWDAAAGTHLWVTGDLFPTGYQAWPDRPVRPGETAHFTVPLTAPARVGLYPIDWQMVGPEGPIGPSATAQLQVQSGAITATLWVDQPKRLVRAGDPLTLTLEIRPAMDLAAVLLGLRFDPARLRLEGVVPGLDLRPQWKADIDNEQGQASLTIRTAAGERVGRLVVLRWRALGTGPTGFWIEQSEAVQRDGTALVLPALWVPLEVNP